MQQPFRGSIVICFVLYSATIKMCHAYGDGDSEAVLEAFGRHSSDLDMEQGKSGDLHSHGQLDAVCAALQLASHKNCTDSYAEFGRDLRNRGVAFCEATWDSASCWPPTLAGLQAVVACPPEFHDVIYDTTINATRFCQENGTWLNQSNYDSCTNATIQNFVNDAINNNELAHYGILGVYYVGYLVSLASSCVALWLFIYFRTLHCLRNTLHCNLIVTYILVDLTWMIMTAMIMADSNVDMLDSSSVESHEWSDGVLHCRIMVALFNYFQVTNFFWMLVEGLYIILIIFRTHKLEMLYFWPFAIVGWGLPILVIVTWMAVKLQYDNHVCWWSDISSSYNFVYIGPILFVLAVNLLFLLTIMHILLRKYRGTTTTAASTRRTAKSFFILLPLLGVTYALILILPAEHGTPRTILMFVTAFFNSMQGFFVSLLYCFLNNEVRSIVRLRGNSFFPYRTWLKLDSSSMRRSPRTLSSCAENNTMLNGTAGAINVIQEPPALSRYRQNENLRQLNINNVTANKNEVAYLLKEKEYQDRIQKQIRHQAMGYRSTVF